MQNQSSNKIIINQTEINAILDTSASTGLVGLLKNAHLLAIANQSSSAVPPESISMLHSYIETTAVTLGDTLNALSFVVANGKYGNATEYITPLLLADFAAVVGELLPYLVELGTSLNASPILPAQSPQY